MHNFASSKRATERDARAMPLRSIFKNLNTLTFLLYLVSKESNTIHIDHTRVALYQANALTTQEYQIVSSI